MPLPTINGEQFGYYDILTLNAASVALTDFQVKKTIPWVPHMQSDFADLRFTTQDDTLIPYWIESKTDSVTAEVWIKIPKISAVYTTRVSMYYGNPGVSNASSGADTFPYLFDDFSTDRLGSYWNGDTGSYEITDGELHHTGGGTFHRINHQINLPSSDDWVFYASIKSVASNERVLIGLSTHTVHETDDSVRGDLNGSGTIAWGKYVNGSFTSLSGAFTAAANTYHEQEIKKNGTTFTFHLNDSLKDTETITEYDTNYSVSQNINDSYCNLIYIRKNTATEPTWAADSGEQHQRVVPQFM